jgi:hypothetical protein
MNISVLVWYLIISHPVRDENTEESMFGGGYTQNRGGRSIRVHEWKKGLETVIVYTIKCYTILL